MQKESLGDAVKRIREASGLSLAEVSVKSGIDLAVSYINRIENNQVFPDTISVGRLKGLAKGIRAPEDYIFDLARGKKLNEQIAAEYRFVEITAGFKDLPEQERRNLEPFVQAIENAIERHRDKPVKATGKKSGEEKNNEQGEEKFRPADDEKTAPQVLPESEYEKLGLKKVDLKKKKTLNTK